MLATRAASARVTAALRVSCVFAAGVVIVVTIFARIVMARALRRVKINFC